MSKLFWDIDKIKVSSRDYAKRAWELDALRGIAIVMMVIFHFLFDLNFFGIAKIAVYEGFLLIFQRTTATLFLLIVGMLLAINYKNGKTDFSYYLKRAALLFVVAIIITIVTWVYPHNGFIVFGIIHLIAVSVLLSYFFVRYSYINLFLGLGIILAGLMLSNVVLNTNLLTWFGISFPGFYTLDYFPLFPWFGIVLLGIFLGKYIYFERKLTFPQFKNTAVDVLSYLGQRSLVIYLIHQPILLSILFIYKYYLP